MIAADRAPSERQIPPAGIGIADEDRKELEAGAAALAGEITSLRTALKDKPDQLDFLPFVGISVVAELVLIFGLGRPQMKPLERVGWGLLWGFAAAVFAAAFWDLVYAPVL